MTFAVAALVNKASGKLQHVLWVLEAANSDQAEADAMAVALRSGTLVSILVKPAELLQQVCA